MPRPARELRPHESTHAFFGAELRHWRKQRGHSQEELGRLVLHSGDLIAKVEKASRWPSQQLAQRCDLVLETGGALSRLLPLVLAERAERGADDDPTPVRPDQWLPSPDAATVSRPLEQSAVVEAVRKVAESELPGVVLVTGPGGFGKTTLALAACRDPRLSELFDTIVWVELGPECGPARLVQVAADICERLGVERPSPTGPEQAGFRVAEVLADKRVLLVLDNVWSPADLAPFLLGGSATVRLVTTRNSGVSRSAAAAVPVPPMTKSQIAEILRTGDGEQLRGHATMALATSCQGWPLLASVVGGTVSRDLVGGASEVVAVGRAVTALRDEGPDAFDVEDVGPGVGTIGRVLRSSLDHLDQSVTLRAAGALSDRYLDLAIFPPAVPIPVLVLAQWWGAEHGWTLTTARQFARVLDQRSLLDTYRAGEDTLVLHDVFRASLTSLERRPSSEAHKSLVEALRALAPHGWHRLESSHTYLWRHLPYHLECAGLWEELVELLADPRYVIERIRVCGSAPFIDDAAALDRYPEHVDPDLRDAARAIIRAAPLAANSDRTADAAASLLVGLAWENQLHSAQADELRSSSSIVARWALPDTDGVSGHTGAVTSVVAAGDRVVSGGEDGTVRIWDRASGRLLRTLRGHHGWVYTVALSDTADIVVSAGDDTTIRLWRASTGEPIGVLTGHTKRIRSLTLTRADQLVVSSSEDGTVIVWSLDRLARLRDLVTDLSPVWSVAVNEKPMQGGALVAIGGQDQSVRIYDLDSGRLLAESDDGHTDWVRTVAFAPDTSLLVSGSGDGSVSLWSATTQGLTLLRRTATGQRVRSLALSSGAGRVLAAGEDATVHDITADATTTVATMPDGVDWIRAITTTADDSLIAGCEDGGLRLLQRSPTADRNTLTELAAGRSAVWSAAFTADGALTLLGDHAGTIRILRTETPDTVAEIDAGTGRVWALAASANVVAAACGDGSVRAWRIRDRQPTITETDDAGRAWDVAVDPSASRLATSFGSGVVTVRDIGTGELLWRRQAHRGRIRSLAFSTDGNLLVTGGGDSASRVWDTHTGSPVTELLAGAGWVRAVAINDDTTMIAAGLGSGDITVNVLEQTAQPTSGRPATSHLFGHSGRVLRLGFLSDERRVSAAADGTIRLWSIPERRQLAQVRIDGSLHCAALHTATGSVAAASASGVVALTLNEHQQEP